MSQTMKQVGTRNIGCSVDLMEWNNKMDLLAFSTEKGEVIIQRLNWQKIVTFPRPSEDVLVRSLSWQLDGTVLAAGYSSGQVALLDAEREDLVSGLSFDGDINKIYFSRKINVKDYRNIYRNQTELSHESFLAPLPTLNGISAPTKTTHEFKYFPKNSPCYLVVIMKNGIVHLLLLGALKAGTIDLTKYIDNKNDFDIKDVRFNFDFNSIYALIRDGNQLKLLHFQNNVLKEHMSPLLRIAVQCANVLETKSYLHDTVQGILESWETVLIEMDNKLTKYANAQPEGSLSADFLELLLFGYATHEIEEFLMDELTEKGLKKMATSVDLCYSTVQSLVSKPLFNAGLNMFYFLNTLTGMARFEYLFESLISLEAASEALRFCGALLLKIQEMQQVIHQSVTEIKLFFCWLSQVIVRLHQHDATDETTQFTTKDISYLAEYLNKFEDKIIVNEDGSVTKRKFNLEKVGQYLENKNLQQQTMQDGDELWNKLLEENECLRSCKLLYPHDKHTSLIQQRDKLLEAVDNLFNKPNDTINTSFELDSTINCGSLHEDPTLGYNYIQNSFCVNEETKLDIFLTTISSQELLLIEFNRECTAVNCMRIVLHPSPSDARPNLENLHFVHLKFYNENTISMLLENSHADKQQSYFLQLSIDESIKASRSKLNIPNNLILSNLTPAQHIFNMTDPTNLKEMESVCTQVAVSGKRKLASILADNKKKITIFDMEIEEEEDDTEISHTSLLEFSRESSANISQH